MSRRRLWLSRWYLFLASVALVTCWRQNLEFTADTHVTLVEALATFWPALLANHATTSITIDIFLFGVAVITWMAVEGRRIGMRYVWLYVVLGFGIAISVTVPVFLAARERRLHALGEPDPEVTRTDVFGIAFFAVPLIAFALWTLGR